MHTKTTNSFGRIANKTADGSQALICRRLLRGAGRPVSAQGDEVSEILEFPGADER